MMNLMDVKPNVKTRDGQLLDSEFTINPFKKVTKKNPLIPANDIDYSDLMALLVNTQSAMDHVASRMQQVETLLAQRLGQEEALKVMMKMWDHRKLTTGVAA